MKLKETKTHFKCNKKNIYKFRLEFGKDYFYISLGVFSVPAETLGLTGPHPPMGSASVDFGTSTYRRLYQNDGMIPKYTGYIPRKPIFINNTL